MYFSNRAFKKYQFRCCPVQIPHHDFGRPAVSIMFAAECLSEKKRNATKIYYKKKVIKFTCYLFVFIYGSNESSSDTVCRKVHLYFQQDKRLYVESTLISIASILNIHI